MAHLRSRQFTDKDRNTSFACFNTVKGCSDILAVGIDRLAQPCQPAPTAEDVRCSLVGALQHLQSYHGPIDSVQLPHAGEKGALWLEGASVLRQQSDLPDTTAFPIFDPTS
jgi:hypothetical protein